MDGELTEWILLCVYLVLYAMLYRTYTITDRSRKSEMVSFDVSLRCKQSSNAFG